MKVVNPLHRQSTDSLTDDIVAFSAHMQIESEAENSGTQILGHSLSFHRGMNMHAVIFTVVSEYRGTTEEHPMHPRTSDKKHWTAGNLNFYCEFPNRLHKLM